jgi:hypothetical protein
MTSDSGFLVFQLVYPKNLFHLSRRGSYQLCMEFIDKKVNSLATIAIMMLSISSNAATAATINDAEFYEQNKFNTWASKNIPLRTSSGGNGNSLNGTMQRRGSTGYGIALNSTKVTGSNIRINSFRDKLSKFKDSSFRRSMKFTKGSKMDSFSEQLNNSSHFPAVSEKRKVTFAKSRENVVHEIEACLDLPKKDIWWTAEELTESRSKGHILALTDPCVKKYILTYDEAQREVHTRRKLSSDQLKELVHLLSKGYLGLEALFNTSVRVEAIRDHVVSVVRFYRELSLENSAMNFNESFSSQSSCSIIALNANTYEVRSRNVRNHSSKMSASNRHFAAALGNAEYLASIIDSRPERNGGKLLHRQTSL